MVNNSTNINKTNNHLSMVNNSTNIIKTNNHFSPQIIEHKKRIQDLAWERQA